MFNRRAFRVHHIKANEGGAGFQDVFEIIGPTLKLNGKKERLCHQAKRDAIFDVYVRKYPLGFFSGVQFDS